MIDARSLHGWLGVGRDFSTWFAQRVRAYGFEEGVDYSPEVGRIKTRGQPRRDYLLTLDMAKELAMVERTQIGRMTRA